MSGTGHSAATVLFYETHPINEDQILQSLQNDGVALDTVSEEILKNYDQDHFGGIEAVDILAEKAGVQAHSHVLDVCSGMGGPARYLAHYYGCRVTGLDITESRFHSSRRLTQRVKLDHLVNFQLGDATAMPFTDNAFDIVIGQEAWAHVPNKPKLIGECARVLKAFGTLAFTDILNKPALTDLQAERLQREMSFFNLASADDYVRLLQQKGFELISQDDLSANWTEILQQRLAMYRSLKDKTIDKFGETHFLRWDETYSFFVGLYASGQLGGGRFVARRNA
jgi:ubiquinone/menaquinone biosynthesis C-methylase UbiE